MNSDTFIFHRMNLDESEDFRVILSEFILNSTEQYEILESLKSNNVILNDFSGSCGRFYLFENEFYFKFEYYKHDLKCLTENVDSSKKLILTVMHISEY